MLACNAMPFTLPSIEVIAGTSVRLEYNVYLRNRMRPIDLCGGSVIVSLSKFSDQEGHIVLSKEMDVTCGPHTNQEGVQIGNKIIGNLSSEDTTKLLGKYIYQITIRNDIGEEESKQGILNVFKKLGSGNNGEV